MTTQTLDFQLLQSAIIDAIDEADMLLYADVDRDAIWEAYLDGFDDPADRQEHNCNCCKSFLRQFGGLILVRGDEAVSLWGAISAEGYDKAIDNLYRYVSVLSITSVFFTPFKVAGTPSNYDAKRSVTWDHMYFNVPNANRASDAGTKAANSRSAKEVLHRILDETSLITLDTVLDLITSGSLYRGNEFRSNVQKLRDLKLGFEEAKLAENTSTEVFCWINCKSPVARIRNSAIGTLLVDLNEGMDLEKAVTRFEKVVAPHNYKRPKAIVTTRMVEEAKQELTEAGLIASIDRRFATYADVPVRHMLFVDRDVTENKDVFDAMSASATVNTKKLSRVEQVPAEKFVSEILPSARTVEVLLENRHLPRMFSLLTAKDPECKHLFKWNNHFSWAYSGDVADSIAEKVKAAGGNVVGCLRASLAWSNYDDLDLHCIEPNRNHIFYNSAGRKHRSSGCLDVDMNAGSGRSREPVENIIWTNQATMPNGKYEIYVHNYSKRESIDVGFSVEIEFGGETFLFESPESPRQGGKIVVCNVVKQGNTFTVEPVMNCSPSNKTKWGLTTNSYAKVQSIMWSPNHWDCETGNRHLLLALDGCKSDEATRPFFNEFVSEDLKQHRRVLELMGGKLKLEPPVDQVSGIGFADTQRDSLTLRITGNYTRNIEVLF